MRMAPAVRRGMAIGLAVGAVALGLPARAQPTEDLTGIYSAKSGELGIIQGDNQILVFYAGTYPQGISVGICECVLRFQHKQLPSGWILQSTNDAEQWTLRADPGKLTLQGPLRTSCCGARWPGEVYFPRASPKPPQSCKVTVPRADFDPWSQSKKRKPFVVQGDPVEAYIPRVQPDLVLARFKGPKKSTAGELNIKHIQCPPPAPTAPGSAPGVPADGTPSHAKSPAP